nr:hypothetical protein [Tanacetum cinerariifolium]
IRNFRDLLLLQPRDTWLGRTSGTVSDIFRHSESKKKKE